MKTITTSRLNSAVSALCPEIWSNISSTNQFEFTEKLLWEELVCCILSSQVKFETSQLFTKSLKKKGLLNPKLDCDKFETKVKGVLTTPVKMNKKQIKYRFPNIKAKQINMAKENIYGMGITIKNIFNEYTDPENLRSHLVSLIPGLGMKQASMYLRNTANSYNLAVIDSHVLRYMNVIELVENIPSTINKSQYLNKEKLLSNHAKGFGYPVGCVDFAIWIVMRVAQKDRWL